MNEKEASLWLASNIHICIYTHPCLM